MTIPGAHNDCRACIHIDRGFEGWEFPDIWWWECSARPGMANLTSFPFRNTSCPQFKETQQ